MRNQDETHLESMSSTNHPVSWPASLKGEVITLVDLFFQLLDSKSPQAGSQLVQDVFTEDGKFFSSSGYFQGQDIALSREGIWEAFEIRSHELRKIYLNDANGQDLDLLIVGGAVIKPHGGKATALEFIGRAVVQDTIKGPRIRYYQPIVPNSAEQPILANV
ncbi:uncharacterized protein PV07_04080 [Cladophialophora immunda]|uniref:SnoaL-like domain-containing protein n=1 Tax=Cladophialophora immunda TaxID=569365 RepID=A0A0D2DA52_9EURO|nr:uncharacterized protein PV07_04080 [Cladophialophora immunda]KIW32549.1 hypothetical protein PV07_04080 [Cladophialophora immunda]